MLITTAITKQARENSAPAIATPVAIGRGEINYPTTIPTVVNFPTSINIVTNVFRCAEFSINASLHPTSPSL